MAYTLKNMAHPGRFLGRLLNLLAIAAIFFSGWGFYSLCFGLVPLLVIGIEYKTSPVDLLQLNKQFLAAGQLVGTLFTLAISALLLYFVSVQRLSLVGAGALAGVTLVLSQILSLLIITRLQLAKKLATKGKKIVWLNVLFRGMIFVLIGHFIERKWPLTEGKRRWIATVVTMGLVLILLRVAAPVEVVALVVAMAAYLGISAIAALIEAGLKKGFSKRPRAIMGGIAFGIAVMAAMVMLAGVAIEDKTLMTLGFFSLPALSFLSALVIAVSLVAVVAVGLKWLKHPARDEGKPSCIYPAIAASTGVVTPLAPQQIGVSPAALGRSIQLPAPSHQAVELGACSSARSPEVKLAEPLQPLSVYSPVFLPSPRAPRTASPLRLRAFASVAAGLSAERDFNVI